VSSFVRGTLISNHAAGNPAFLRQKLARSSVAVRRLRGFPPLDALLRMLLLHVGCGWSLREKAVQAKLAEIAEISDITLLNCLRDAENWLRKICQEMWKENGVQLQPSFELEPCACWMPPLFANQARPAASGGFLQSAPAYVGVRSLRPDLNSRQRRSRTPWAVSLSGPRTNIGPMRATGIQPA
jgi:hypothetical protein